MLVVLLLLDEGEDVGDKDGDDVGDVDGTDVVGDAVVGSGVGAL